MTNSGYGPIQLHKKQEKNNTHVPALPFTSSFIGCRKPFSKHGEVMLNCFELKL